MGKLHFRKHGQALVPADDEAANWLLKKKDGVVIRGDFAEFRNYKYHCKFFTMLDYAFDIWDPDLSEYRGIVPEKNPDTFRSDMLILAGHREAVVNIKGEVKYIAKSISFGKVKTDAEFEKIYNPVLNVILKHVLTNYTREDVDRVVDELMNFA